MIERVLETYTWRVVYHDERGGIHENAANSFADVDQSRVKSLFLVPLRGGPPHRVSIPKGAQPLFFRRRRIELNPNTDEQTHKTVHCIGWKRDDEAVYLFVLDDNSTLLSDNLQAI